ncbi:FAD/NAD(P)-binding domain-containing protein [Saccharata proteae CBS 121410]|uniref:FAD/NAD(P)-binding domain-containing protein n=1 Tax=Saccharata proteae CBS 121410 TaxID=1314787 RepID=A0A9P4HYF4_9PEZI|nr:FAD/NAD(P)-binding domain-containing protein [Saccharata proteae CBS 121410]
MPAVPNLPATITTEDSGTAPNELPPTTESDTHHTTNGTTTSNHASSDTSPDFQLYDHPIENQRPMKVIVIGAGFSGIYCGIRIPERLRNVELVIYEKNEGVGGTWYENRYPGCACDVPSHSYQYSFEPNHNWSSLYAPSYEIQAYLAGVVKKYGADRFIKLGHQIVESRFHEKEGKWHVKVKNLGTGEMFEDVGDVVISARGNLNNIAWPKIEGLERFEGEVMHSAKWNQEYDFRNKRVGIIGSGSSAIQIIPRLQKVSGAHLSCFVRSKTWISPPFGQEMYEKLGLDGLEISDAQKAKFAADPTFYKSFRLAIEEDSNNIHGVTLRDHPLQIAAQKAFADHMRTRLASEPAIFDALLPSFRPGCRRLTPGPGFLEALVEPNVDFLTSPITGITPTGVLTADNTHHEVDVLVCATGFHTSAPPPFPVHGANNTTIQARWQDRAESYLSLAVDGFPNHFLMLGPNSAIGSGSLTMMIEATGDYIVRAIRKLQKENIKTMAVSERRVKDFTLYVDRYFERTVFTDECRSWYRNGVGSVTGLWPGSTLHCVEAMRSPRWEDWEYVYLGEEEGEEVNRLAWLGNGWSLNQLEGRDLAWYLYDEFVDRPGVGRPEEGGSGKYEARAFSY